MTGVIFDIKRFAIHDGPGIRTTVFLKGCPLNCLWCQNPEGIESGMGLWVKWEQCIHCGVCVSLCPVGALSFGEGQKALPHVPPEAPRINRETCSLCGICTEHCPSRAIRRIETEISPEALAEELLLDRVFFDVSGGGVTLSGGEPLAQPEFALALLELLKKKGIHTCMETSLFAPEKVVQKFLPLLDSIICDIKLLDDDAHRKYTGQSNGIILENFRRIAQDFPGIIARVPLINGITAKKENLMAVGDFIRSCGTNIKTELINYNWFSTSKYAWLDKPHFNIEARAFSEEEMTRFYSYMWFDPEAYRKKPLFLTDLQCKIAALHESEKQEVRFLLTMDRQGRYRKLVFDLPGEKLLSEYPELFKRYALAMINNMLVSFGGASLDIFFNSGNETISGIMREAVAEFDLDRKDNRRRGYGSYINYINRMNKFLGLGSFRISLRGMEEWKEPDGKKEFRLYVPDSEQGDVELLRRAALDTEGKCFCSLDVGGNSIKGAVVSGNEIILTKEYQWFPAGIKTADEMNGHQLLLLRFLGDCTGAVETGHGLATPPIADAFDPSASYEKVLDAVRFIEAWNISPLERFDAIVIGFPDIVVSNKIAGGETFKQQGMKNNPDVDYETEFSKTSDLDNLIRPYVKKGAPVIILNDTNTASFLFSIEQSMAEKSIINEHGMFVNTVGTEMGTGFVSSGGTIHYIPLEDYQHVIDLGNSDYWKYPPSDIRSINNLNTGIPGTVQKYVTQFGLFRLAVSEFMEKDKSVVEALSAQGLIRYYPTEDHIEIVTEPINTREKLTWLLSDKMLREKNSVIEAVFSLMGKAMGILIDQDLLLFPEIMPVRIMSGGIMADDDAFRIFRNAVKEHNPFYEVIRLDEKITHTPLLKKLPREKRNFTVAVGSAYIGNRFLLEREET